MTVILTIVGTLGPILNNVENRIGELKIRNWGTKNWRTINPRKNFNCPYNNDETK